MTSPVSVKPRDDDEMARGPLDRRARKSPSAEREADDHGAAPWRSASRVAFTLELVQDCEVMFVVVCKAEVWVAGVFDCIAWIK